MRPDDVGALVFDVFGTVVNWRTSVIEESAAFGARHGIDADWPAFADEWRNAGYTGGMKRVASGELPWIKVDELHRMKLDEMLSGMGVFSRVPIRGATARRTVGRRMWIVHVDVVVWSARYGSVAMVL